MITKKNLREKDSNFYKSLKFIDEPILFTISDDEVTDFGKIMFALNYPFEYWNIILKYNDVIDPFEDLPAGTTLLIPPQKDLVNLEVT